MIDLEKAINCFVENVEWVMNPNSPCNGYIRVAEMCAEACMLSYHVLIELEEVWDKGGMAVSNRLKAYPQITRRLDDLFDAVYVINKMEGETSIEQREEIWKILKQLKAKR